MAAASDDWDYPTPSTSSTGGPPKTNSNTNNSTNNSSNNVESLHSKSDFQPDNNYVQGDIKIILVGDSAVGKSKLVERFLCDQYTKHTASTYAVNIFSHKYSSSNGTNSIPGSGPDANTNNPNNKTYLIDFWDTAGQEQFSNLHPSFFFDAHCAILVFDVTRKITYKNLEKWYQSCQDYCLGGGRGGLPIMLIANKIDSDPSSTTKKFQFAIKNNLPFYFVSAADGTNVVRIFDSAIQLAIKSKEGVYEGGTGERDELMDDLLALLREDDTNR